MTEVKLSEISSACGGTLVSARDCVINDITTDSRKVREGSLFAAIPGKRTDGHKFIEAAKNKGASAVLCEKKPENADIPYILADSTVNSLQTIARYILEKSGIPVVGIGGSVGKTSTKEAVASVLGQKFCVLKTQGNFNNELGLPLSIFNLTDENNAAVLEMGISDFGEMHLLASIARPDICVLTNIGDCHLENLKNREGVFRAKTEMFDFIDPSGSIVLNGDDEFLSRVENIKGINPIFFGLKKTNDVWADGIRDSGIDGEFCVIHSSSFDFEVFLPKPGIHMIYNALAAASVGMIMGLSADEIKNGLENQDTLKGRFNIISKNGFTIIDDCYNANPMSMKASLENLSMANGRKIAILGDMGELGENEAALHKEVGVFAASLKLDAVVCIGFLSRYIAEEVSRNAVTKVFCFDTVEEFEKNVGLIIKEGGTALIKASHFMKFEKVVDAVLKVLEDIR